ncbi:MAG: tetraacyldisaccharide 4'-kinase [Candidatus Omnitrophica bacterium]|nr:tetraacyldisaccharide 4'-kinase [Candidatus Omnitrophota bacterium]
MGELAVSLPEETLSRMPKFLISAGEGLYRAGWWGIQQGYSRRLLKTHRLAAQVVSVGNLTWGGTGKTPLVVFLAQALRKQGYRVAVLTRGYGGDEQQVLAHRLPEVPVFVGPDRVASGTRAVREAGANLLLLDDGYQQWRLEKDVEILTVDAARPFGNGHLIPRGSLREPPESAARADVIVLKAAGCTPEQVEQARKQVRARNPEGPVFVMDYRPASLWSWPGGEPMPLSRLKGRKVCTLAGIGLPRGFEALVGETGAKAVLRCRFRDHHAYTAGEMIRMFLRCKRHDVQSIVTTAKDAVRLPRMLSDATGPDLKGMEILVLEIEPEFEPNESELLHRIGSLLVGPGR